MTLIKITKSRKGTQYADSTHTVHMGSISIVDTLNPGKRGAVRTDGHHSISTMSLSSQNDPEMEDSELRKILFQWFMTVSKMS